MSDALPIAGATAAKPPSKLPTPVLPPVTEPDHAIAALFDQPIPHDARDPQAIAQRVDVLGQAAAAAAEAMIEFLTRLGEERRLGTHVREGGCVLNCTDTMIALHRAIVTFQREGVRYDGLDVARAAIERDYGSGVADLVMFSLASLREELNSLIRETI
jgi:hypothetical protein